MEDKEFIIKLQWNKANNIATILCSKYLGHILSRVTKLHGVVACTEYERFIEIQCTKKINYLAAKIRILYENYINEEDITIVGDQSVVRID